MTRHHAKTFYFASHVLPAQKRSDAYAVYAFCRHVDDQIDLAPDEAARGRAFADLEHLLHAAFQPGDETEALERSLPWLSAFRETVRRRAIPQSYFEDLLKGVEMDRCRVRLANWDELDRYCYHVAAVVGLIMVHVLTEPSPELLKPARDLGTAMQLTNILRDIREDQQNGRVYLPAEDLAKFSVDFGGDDPAPQGFVRLVEFEVDRARDWYATGWKLLGLLDRRSAACTGAMAGIYRRLLERIAAEPAAVLRERVSLSGREKATVAVKALTGRFG